ncbi:MAG TPA: glutamate synthase-related protein [Mycolicibacillus parakoreensis]|uniref:Glutamate synthase-related protein n=1 Tax=Mycolicibacillus parakoreensis TaxID=1069221 RepID=A0ABY3TZC5_9MYCO|nr:glutamate synthase-related protein [Mycolicibacillus parakoreensis]ULN51236.1 glutamate synthase-related protein [Mycolicibacillus parakoreensis]HLR98886.1 glutamate synthase-related protein [Mycolicibacillus parakoreensis]
MKPVVAENKPIAVELEADREYHWCRCGRSANQPFCDGSHRGTGFTPVAFTAEKDGEAWLCQCKQTRDAPFCDGHHTRVPDAMVGREFALDGDSDDSDDSDDRSDRRSRAPEARPTPEEPTVAFIHRLAREGLSTLGAYGEMGAMGVPRSELPDWDDIQLMTAQLARQPLLEDVPVGTGLVIGPEARKPLELQIPLLVSDMSFGALSEEAKLALARGAEQAGTGICSGEGGMLPEEQQASSRYLLEYGSAGFGYRDELLALVQAFHFKGGQAAKTGTGGHLPGNKVVGRIAEIRGLPEGRNADSPPTFTDLHTVDDFARFAAHVREVSGGIPVGFKLSAQHIERDIEFAVRAGADYIILDGRGGGTGDAPLMFRDHISVPTIPALARARRCLDALGASGRVTLIITGGLRTHTDFVKALALGADGIAVANSAIQAVGCVGARICNTNLCPSGVATQDPALRARLDVDVSADRLATFLAATTVLMQVMARACGHDHLAGFGRDDLASWHKPVAELAGIDWSGYRDDR